MCMVQLTPAVKIGCVIKLGVCVRECTMSMCKSLTICVEYVNERVCCKSDLLNLLWRKESGLQTVRGQGGGGGPGRAGWNGQQGGILGNIC